MFLGHFWSFSRGFWKSGKPQKQRFPDKKYPNSQFWRKTEEFGTSPKNHENQRFWPKSPKFMKNHEFWWFWGQNSDILDDGRGFLCFGTQKSSISLSSLSLYFIKYEILWRFWWFLVRILTCFSWNLKNSFQCFSESKNTWIFTYKVVFSKVSQVFRNPLSDMIQASNFHVCHENSDIENMNIFFENMYVVFSTVILDKNHCDFEKTIIMTMAKNHKNTEWSKNTWFFIIILCFLVFCSTGVGPQKTDF